MHRIDNATAAASLPTPAAPGTPGYWTKGDPGLGTPATVMDQDFFNAIQEELIGLLAAGGVTPAKGTNDQVAKVLKRLAAGNVTSVSATATLTADQVGLVLVSAASGDVTLTLPAANAAAGAPLRFIVQRTDSSANVVTIQRGGSDTINGLTTALTLPVGATVQMVSNGAAAWRILGGAGLVDSRALTEPGTTSQTVPIWATRMNVEVWGAGGGGGGCSAAGAARGGGGGEYRRGSFVVTPGASLSCTVGAGGAGGSNSPTSGAIGGTSSVGALVSAIGGDGGSGSGGGVASAGGGGGTGGSGGQYARAGASSELSYAIGASYNNSIGGGSFGAGYGAFVVANNGNNGWAVGVGGNGGANGAALGGGGAAGLILIEFLP